LVAIGVEVFCYELSIFANYWTIGRFQKSYNKKDFIPFYVVAQAVAWAFRKED